MGLRLQEAGRAARTTAQPSGVVKGYAHQPWVVLGESTTNIMRTVQELNNSKSPIVRIDPSLEQYRDKVLFPEKLAKANEMLKTAKLPGKKRGN